MFLDYSLLLTPEVEDHKSQCMVINRNKEMGLLLKGKKRPAQDSLLAVVFLKETFLGRVRRKRRQPLNSTCYRIFQNKKKKKRQTQTILWGVVTETRCLKVF